MDTENEITLSIPYASEGTENQQGTTTHSELEAETKATPVDVTPVEKGMEVQHDSSEVKLEEVNGDKQVENSTDKSEEHQKEPNATSDSAKGEHKEGEDDSHEIGENEEEEEEGEEEEKKGTKKKGGKRKGKKGKRGSANSTPKKEDNNRRRSTRNKGKEDDPTKKQKIDDDEDEDMEDEEDNKLYCVCRKAYDGSFMVACDSCLEWYHPSCIGFTEDKLKKMKKYICDKCKPNSDSNGSDVLKRKDEIEKKLEKLHKELDDVNRRVIEDQEKKRNKSPLRKNKGGAFILFTLISFSTFVLLFNFSFCK